MNCREPHTCGQLLTEQNEHSLAMTLQGAFPDTQERESSHYLTGSYVVIDIDDDTEFFFEKISDSEYLIRGESGDLKSLQDAAEAIAKHVGRHGLRCRLETYDENDSLSAYAHHDWPQSVGWLPIGLSLISGLFLGLHEVTRKSGWS